MIKKILAVAAIILIVFGAQVYIVNASTSVSESFDAPFNIKDFRSLLGGIIDWLIRIAIPIAILVIVISGVMFMAAQGNPDQINKAKKIFLWALAGLVVILLSKGIEGFIKSIFDLANG